jgi:starvation-inducible outer membrane lipoprotein
MRLLAAAALLTAGCATAPPAEVGGRCDSAGAQKLIGRAKSAATGKQALRLSGATALRWIAPGAMATMDYRENRVNLRVDPAGRIVKVDCG